jgi:septal ring factor EnvC (AmiA/AmiB activator)
VTARLRLAVLLAAAWHAAGAEPTRQELQRTEAARAAQLAAGREAAERLHVAQAEAHRLAEARAAAAASLAARAADLAALLPLIERLSLYPAETLLVVPAAPEPALRGLLVLKGMARQIEVDAEAVRAEQAELARLAARMTEQEKRLATAQAAQAAQAAMLDQKLADARARGQAAEDEVTAASRRAAEQAAQADSLRAALAQLEASRAQEEARARAEAEQAERRRQGGEAADARHRQAAIAAPAGPGLAEPRGEIGAPVAGAVIRAFGAPGDAGPATGISYQAPPAARVVAPCGGRVVFAGPFRSYGLLLILDCGGGYHFVLAGLDRLDVAVGRPVQPGEPVGVMPSWDPRNLGGRPALYVELRKGGVPINPTPFLRGRS